MDFEETPPLGPKGSCLLVLPALELQRGLWLGQRLSDGASAVF